jgi:hypothetical protein
MAARLEHLQGWPLQPLPFTFAARGVCADCGAHLICTVGLATVAGTCSVCGGADVVPLPSPPAMSPISGPATTS